MIYQIKCWLIRILGGIPAEDHIFILEDERIKRVTERDDLLKVQAQLNVEISTLEYAYEIQGQALTKLAIPQELKTFQPVNTVPTTWARMKYMLEQKDRAKFLKNEEMNREKASN